MVLEFSSIQHVQWCSRPSASCRCGCLPGIGRLSEMFCCLHCSLYSISCQVNTLKRIPINGKAAVMQWLLHPPSGSVIHIEADQRNRPRLLGPHSINWVPGRGQGKVKVADVLPATNPSGVIRLLYKMWLTASYTQYASMAWKESLGLPVLPEYSVI